MQSPPLDPPISDLNLAPAGRNLTGPRPSLRLPGRRRKSRLARSGKNRPDHRFAVDRLCAVFKGCKVALVGQPLKYAHRQIALLLRDRTEHARTNIAGVASVLGFAANRGSEVIEL
jgi:hypothetical protein